MLDRQVLLLGLCSILFSCVLSTSPAGCTHPIYCSGELLGKIQTAHLFHDSKVFVDMPTRVEPSVVLEAFTDLPPQPSQQDWKRFLDKYFWPAGTEVKEVEPVDWNPSPPFLSQIKDSKMREWAAAVHHKWKELVREFDHTLSCADCFSSLWVPHPFVVAGGRFREYYYWDTYWIIEGLLISRMYTTAKGMLINFLYIVEKYGFVPNGGRIYYLNRSQPPLLTQMVQRYFDVTGDNAFLEKALPILEQEYSFWMQRQVHLDHEGTTYDLTIYNVSNYNPRPESYIEDLNVSLLLPPSKRASFFSNIAAGAETGWDFSSRWFSDKKSLQEIQTNQVVPVDLNSIVYQNEMSLSNFFSILGNVSQEQFYKDRADKRLKGMKVFLWDESDALWYDYNWAAGQKNKEFYASTFFPFWVHDFGQELGPNVLQKVVDKAVEVTSYAGGLPTSLLNSSQQWDFPNAWAPLQFTLIEALHKINSTSSNTLSLSLTQKWLTNNYCGWLQTKPRGGFMFEKYDATRIGAPGGGGEYEVQEGFGWTNGVALFLIAQFGNMITLPSTCP